MKLDRTLYHTNMFFSTLSFIAGYSPLAKIFRLAAYKRA